MQSLVYGNRTTCIWGSGYVFSKVMLFSSLVSRSPSTKRQIFRNVRNHTPSHTALYRRRLDSSKLGTFAYPIHFRLSELPVMQTDMSRESDKIAKKGVVTRGKCSDHIAVRSV